jgi:hypothetical protein
MRKVTNHDLAGLISETIVIGNAAKQQLDVLGIKSLDLLIDADKAFRARLIVEKSSPITALIKKVNNLRDSRFLEIWRTSKAAAKSSIDANVVAGKILVTFLNPYHNIQKEPLISETSTFNFLQKKYFENQEVQDAAQTLQLDMVFTVLFTANDEVAYLWNQRASEDAEKSGPSASSLRKNLEKSYRNFCDIILQILDLSPSTQLEILFNKMNEIRIKYSKSLPTRISDANISVERIPTQKYTGNAITPIPNVLLKIQNRNFRELHFSIDFFVSYKNNTNVGEAKLIIHGKGKYKGSYMTSFYIE